MIKRILGLLLIHSTLLHAQPVTYSAANAHSHNDYEQPIPFWLAYNAGFGSIEADIFLLKDNDNLLVAHTPGELLFKKRRLDSLYLIPIRDCIRKNNGHVYTDSSKKLQVLIDVKTAAVPTLNKFIQTVQSYPELINTPSLQFVISGGRPDPDSFPSYPSFIWFDGELNKTYSQQALAKIVMMSDYLKRYTLWNGKGKLTAKDSVRLNMAVEKSHQLHKPVRFWDAPDNVNAWYGLMKAKVDFINTDRIEGLSGFLIRLPVTSYSNKNVHTVYSPTYKYDGLNRPVKNIILLIGDGTGLSQWYAGYTANKGALNVFKMKHIGLSKTSSYDSYITDSAPGSTAFASGVKTNNRFIGVDHTGLPLLLLPEIFIKRKMITGLISCGDITDATPADFYAHRSDRDSAAAIYEDMARSPVQLLAGAPNKSFNSTLQHSLEAAKYNVVSSVQAIDETGGKKWLVHDTLASLSRSHGRGNWLGTAFDRSVRILSTSKAGFFLMTEGAQVDHGGHGNNLPYVVEEVLDFDEVIGKALAFADKNGETLVIVTGDHETGGLTLLDGNIAKADVSGAFSTDDHTSIPVPVFAYGPRSQLFSGVYENTEVFQKILLALSAQKEVLAVRYQQNNSW